MYCRLSFSAEDFQNQAPKDGEYKASLSVSRKPSADEASSACECRVRIGSGAASIELPDKIDGLQLLREGHATVNLDLLA